jgi:uncharacterized membrane protein YqjE
VSVTTQPPAADPTEPVESESSLAELVSRMTTDVGNLVSTQIELAKVEIKEEVNRAGKGVGMVGGGGLAAYFAVMLLSFAIAFALGDAFDSLPAGFFVMALLYAVAATVLIVKGKDQITSATPVAEQTVTTLKEDLEWARQQRS